MSNLKINISSVLEKVRTKKPLVHHLTNWVTIYDCANVVKVFGASPVMAHAQEEVEEMVDIAGALVLNIGTLTVDFVDSMKKAAKQANKKGIPIVLDVCGVGATSLRNKKSFELLDEVKIDIVKGNASEITCISGEKVQTKGVDSSFVEHNLVDIAKRVAQKYQNIVVITGVDDIVLNQHEAFLVKNGHAMMANIVGTGCMVTSVIGTFAAVEKNLVLAATSGLVCYEVAAQLAAKKSKGPGSFKEKLFDEIFNLKKSTIEKNQKIVKIK